MYGKYPGAYRKRRKRHDHLRPGYPVDRTKHAVHAAERALKRLHLRFGAPRNDSEINVRPYLDRLRPYFFPL